MELPSIKKLGFGLMRLPKSGDEIDLAQVTEMVDRFMAAGFTYFDTAWAYPGSEDAIRQALVERYPRKSFQLATKNAAWLGCKPGRRRSRSLKRPCARPARAISIFICCTIWGSTAPTISTTSTSGISSRRKSGRG
jgi:hypothetical protein